MRRSATPEARSPRGLLDELAERGVVGVATTFVDNSGVTRVKAFPAGQAADGRGLGRRDLDQLRPLPCR